MFTELDLIKKSREIYADHGGAIGTYRTPDGKVCLLGSLREAVNVLSESDKFDPATLSATLSGCEEPVYGHAAGQIEKVRVEKTLGLFDQVIERTKV